MFHLLKSTQVVNKGLRKTSSWLEHRAKHTSLLSKWVWVLVPTQYGRNLIERLKDVVKQRGFIYLNNKENNQETFRAGWW